MKKGFTLIELLAVILILGIIALIAIPQVTNVIEKSREQANLRSLESHIHNIENNLGINMLNSLSLKGEYSFEELSFSKYPENDEIRCESYNINKVHVESASNCLINNKMYCFSESHVYYCGIDDTSLPDAKGKSGSISWELNKKTKTLTIKGTGPMADYNESDLPEWYSEKDDIQNIVIGEDVTTLGKYAFYNLDNVKNIIIKSKKLSNLEKDNFTFANAGTNTTGITLKFASTVTNVPNYLTNSNGNSNTANITKIVFDGTKIKTIGSYALSHTNIDYLILPDSVEQIESNALSSNASLKIVVLSNNIDVIPANLFSNSKTLETVVVGDNTTIIKSKAFYNLNKLKKIVIPNKNTTIESMDIVNKYNSIGLDIFANSSLGSIIEDYKTENNITDIYYFSMSRYRPIVYGDKVNYTVEFDELHYNTSGGFTIKTLSDSDSRFKGVKYRYQDENGKVYLMDGAKYENGTLKDVRIDVFVDADIINKSSATTPAQTVLFFGNSLTTGFGFGMAASDENSDYVYHVMQYVKSFNPDSEFIRYVANPYENSTTSEARNDIVDNKLIKTFESKRNKDKPVKTIILQFGTNVTDPEERETFVTDTTYLINRLKETYPDAKIYWIGALVHPTKTLPLVKESVKKNNVTFIDATYLRDGGDRYKSYIGAIYYRNDKYERVTSGGVGAHPGDYGFTCMANTVIQALKDNNFAVYSNN